MNQKIITYFKKNDPILFSSIKKIGPIKALKPAPPSHYFLHLCKEIVYQQLSGKAAATIFSKFENLFPQKKITPKLVLKIPLKKLREAGLSNSKAQYLKNLAQAVKQKELDLKTLKTDSDSEVIKKLIKIKGIGPWTTEMFLMFTLGREDIFSHGDLGLRNAIKKLYDFKRRPSENQVEKISKKWSPYKTYACLILWKSIDD